jgi:hypothetical protein
MSMESPYMQNPSLVFHLQYSSDLPTIMRSFFYGEHQFVCEIRNLKKPMQWKAWNLKWNHNFQGCAMIARLLHKLVLVCRALWPPLFRLVEACLPWIFILHHYQVFCYSQSKQAPRSNYNKFHAQCNL